MKTARFANIVATAGKPDVHLLLTTPALDPVLQKAIKARRVMTIHQTVTGSKPDFGTIGFVEGVTGQILIFPKSIQAFEDRNVVGIKYDLLKPEPARRVSRARDGQVPFPRPAIKTSKKIVHFPPPRADAGEEGASALKEKVRKALKALADGKQVVAYQLLQTILKN